MMSDLLLKLEQKVEYAIEVIELLNLQIEELEDENTALRTEHDKWRNDLAVLIKRFDHLDSDSSLRKQTNTTEQEEYVEEEKYSVQE